MQTFLFGIVGLFSRIASHILVFFYGTAKKYWLVDTKLLNKKYQRLWHELRVRVFSLCWNATFRPGRWNPVVATALWGQPWGWPSCLRSVFHFRSAESAVRPENNGCKLNLHIHFFHFSPRAQIQLFIFSQVSNLYFTSLMKLHLREITFCAIFALLIKEALRKMPDLNCFFEKI